MEEKVFFKNSKGLNLASVINYPDKKKQYPAIIILHGFTGYKEEAHLEGLAKALVENGFAAIRFDCSGSGESEGTFENDYSVSNYLEDIEVIHDYVQSLKFVNKDRIGIAGHSMGGMLAIIYASQNLEIKACIAISPLTTMTVGNGIKAALERWKEMGWFYKQFSRDNKQIKIPFSFIVDANKFNALDFVDKARSPMGIVVGLADDVVDPNDSRKIFNIANEPKELIEIEGIGHDYKKSSGLIKIVNGRVLDFLKKYL